MPTEPTQPPISPPPPAAGHARIDTSIRPVVTFAIALAIVGVVVLIAIAFLYSGLAHHFAGEDKPGFFNAQRPGPPPPVLQLSPTAEFQALRAHENQVLGSYGWVDRQRGVVHIPIDRAMARYLQQQTQTEQGGAP